METIKKKAFFGVDPGKAGFITVFADGEFSFYLMPYHKVATGELTKKGKPEMKSAFHEEGVLLLAIELRKKYHEYDCYMAIEKVIGREGWSASNNFTFGYTAGLQKMIGLILQAEIEMVRPQKWQSVMFNGFEKVMKKSKSGKTMVHDTKATSAIVAQHYGPDIIFSKQGVRKNDGTIHKIDDNKTDSFLMCLWMKIQVNNSLKK